MMGGKKGKIQVNLIHMNTESTILSNERSTSIKAILTAWLIAGTMDISAASIQVSLAGGNPIRMFKYIASGVFGIEAVSGGAAMAVLGLFFHYTIALIWATLFYIAYPYISRVTKNWIALGFSYGIFVWTIMNLVVVPTSNVPPHSLTLKGSIIEVSILIVCIGLPISFVVRKHFYQKQ